MVKDKSVEVGDETTAVESSVLNVRKEGNYMVEVDVKADPPVGIQCKDSDEYTIVTEPKACRVDVDITCVDKEGTDCSEIETPSFQCNNGEDFNAIRFTYIGGGSCLVVIGAPMGSLFLLENNQKRLKILFYVLVLVQLVTFGILKVKRNVLAWSIIRGLSFFVSSSTAVMNYPVFKTGFGGIISLNKLIGNDKII